MSLRPLVDEVVQGVSSSSAQDEPMVIFVGGKGGVGKTTVAASLALTLAREMPNEEEVLVVSTDPAHSLGDALDVNLRGGEPVVLPLTAAANVKAQEVDAAAALATFREALAELDAATLARRLGVDMAWLQSVGLTEISNVLQNPPPGLDEWVALRNVFFSTTARVIVVDTAPTGHTLRLLALPQFLDGFLGQLLQIRRQLGGLASTFQSLLGGTSSSSAAAAERQETLDKALDKLNNFRESMSLLQRRLQNDSTTQFVICTIPTQLAVAESQRLLNDLTEGGIAVRHVVLNQCFNSPAGGENDISAMAKYYQRRRSQQSKWLQELQTACNEISSCSEKIALTSIPYMEVELVGVAALAYVGRTILQEAENFKHLFALDKDDKENNNEPPRVVICGGKGGVGKTTTSCSLAVAMAAAGHDVAIVSTDPAHSLGDALNIDLQPPKKKRRRRSSGDGDNEENLVDIPLIGVGGNDDNNGGSLTALEVDPTAALERFQSLVDQLVGGSGGGDSTKEDSVWNRIQSILDTLPPGTDEVVALAQVYNLLKRGKYTRIVLDTAPTGHALRMLSTPSFLADLMERLLTIAERINSNAAVKMLLTTAAVNASGSRRESVDSAALAAKSAMLQFQLQMYDLEDLFANVDQTEFLIVTIPTELAVRESVRLLNDLTNNSGDDLPMAVRSIVVNQVLPPPADGESTFVRRWVEGQAASTRKLQQFLQKAKRPIQVTKVPYLDTEPRGVYGLYAVAEELLKDDDNEEEEA